MLWYLLKSFLSYANDTTHSVLSFNVLIFSCGNMYVTVGFGIELKRTSCAYRVDFLLLLVKVYVHHFGLCKT